jgi:hypothetical protein
MLQQQRLKWQTFAEASSKTNVFFANETNLQKKSGVLLSETPDFLAEMVK